jgi:hypothetical protein
LFLLKIYRIWRDFCLKLFPKTCVATAIPAIGTLLFITIPQPAGPTGSAGSKLSLWVDMRAGLAPLGLLVAGPAADAFGIQFWWLLTGAMIVTMGAGGLLVPSIVHIEDQSYRSLQAA